MSPIKTEHFEWSRMRVRTKGEGPFGARKSWDGPGRLLGSSRREPRVDVLCHHANVGQLFPPKGRLCTNLIEFRNYRPIETTDHIANNILVVLCKY